MNEVIKFLLIIITCSMLMACSIKQIHEQEFVVDQLQFRKDYEDCLNDDSIINDSLSLIESIGKVIKLP